MQNNDRSGLLIGIFMIIVLVIGVALFIFSPTSNKGAKTQRTNREVALGCTSDMATKFHIHPRLEIVINGEKRQIPKNIGVEPSCMNPLHTHEDDGTLHVESPEQRDFTLADFFAVWNKSFTREQILDQKIDAEHVIRVMVNGKPSEEYENLILRDKDNIVINYETKENGSTGSSDAERAPEKISFYGTDTKAIPSGATLININDEAYAPNKMAVPKGTTVYFVNNGNTERWPASAKHPTHTAYPNSDIAKCGTGDAVGIFDACRGIKSGEFWAFTFSEPGEWFFHDHLTPKLFGSVTVTQ